MSPTKYDAEFFKDNISQIINFCKELDRFKILLYMLSCWTYASIYVTKLMYYVLSILIKMPDKYLRPLVFIQSRTQDGELINIIRAVTENADVTNRLKFFNQVFWQKGGMDQAFEYSGFNARDFLELINSTVLYLTYAVDRNKISNFPEVKKAKIIKKDSKCFSIENDREEELFLNHVNVF